jgi:hypothetical protein
MFNCIDVGRLSLKVTKRGPGGSNESLAKQKISCRSETDRSLVECPHSPSVSLVSSLAEEAFRLTLFCVALQGAFLEHINHLNALRHLSSPPFKAIEVRTADDLANCDALIIPGGESTTIALVAEREGLLDPLRTFVKYSIRCCANKATESDMGDLCRINSSF